MPGRHAAPGYGGFFRELAAFVAKVLISGAIIFGLVIVFQSVFSSDDDPTTSTTAATTAPSAAPSTAQAITTTTQATTTTTTAPTTTTRPTTTTQPGRDPSEITVLVLNSTTRGGIAADLSETLDDAGYQTLEPDNWPTPFTVSRVWWVEGFEPEGLAIARFLEPGAIVELFQGVAQADIIIVLGASFEG